MYVNDTKQVLVFEIRIDQKHHLLLHYYTDISIQELFLIASPISGFADLHEIIQVQKRFINLKSSFTF